jgi:hypothetical protein
MGSANETPGGGGGLSISKQVTGVRKGAGDPVMFHIF